MGKHKYNCRRAARYFSGTTTAMGCNTSKAASDDGVDFTDDKISEGRQQSVWRTKFLVPSVYAPADVPDDGDKQPDEDGEDDEEAKDVVSDKLANYKSLTYAAATEGKKVTCSSAGEVDFTDDKISEGRQQSVWRTKFRVPSVYAPAETQPAPDENDKK